MNILEELKLSKKQNNDKRYEYLCQKFNTIDYAIKLEKYTIKLQQENEELKDNWNKLKEYIRKNIIYDDVGMKILDPSPLEDYMQELEQEMEDVLE